LTLLRSHDKGEQNDAHSKSARKLYPGHKGVENGIRIMVRDDSESPVLRILRYAQALLRVKGLFSRPETKTEPAK
jgi:hypothetical protein